MEIIEVFKKIVAPEFATMADEDINIFIDEAKIELSEKVWGKRYNRGVALIAAHLIAMSKINSNGGGGSAPIKRTKVGSLEREYAVSTENNDALKLTKFGNEFLRLRRQVLMTPLFV